MQNKVERFGRTPQGDVIHRHTMSTESGFSVSAITYGARLCSIRLPSGTHDPEILLGFDRLEPYLEDHFYFGAMIGRYANRIPRGRFALEGREYQLSLNDEKWTLHGGKRGFDRVLWSVMPSQNDGELRLSYQSADMEQGFPGTLHVMLTYRVENPSTLRIEYEAMTDRPTVVNFTHHPYFNLAGAGRGTIHEHVLQIFAEAYLELDGMLPTGRIATVSGTALDFRQPKSIGTALGRGLATVEGGYDHTYALWDATAPEGNSLRRAARVAEPATQRALEVFTDQPGLQLYTGNELDGSLEGHGGVYPKFASFTLEPEHFPNSVHHPQFPSTRLNPGERYHTTSVFAFSAARRGS